MQHRPNDDPDENEVEDIRDSRALKERNKKVRKEDQKADSNEDRGEFHGKNLYWSQERTGVDFTLAPAARACEFS